MLRRFGLPLVPLIVAVILTPRADEQMRRALQVNGGDVLDLLTHSPATIAIYGVIGAVLLLPLIRRLIWRS
jgi:putative tricarboxylic transport membrane protein